MAGSVQEYPPPSFNQIFKDTSILGSVKTTQWMPRPMPAWQQGGKGFTLHTLSHLKFFSVS